MGSPKIITLSERLTLHFLRVSSKPIIEVRRLLLENGIEIPVRDLSNHTLAGGDVREIGSALVEARLRSVPLEFTRACALDLARDKSDPTQRAVNVVRRAAQPQEMLLGPRGPLEFAETGKFTWRPRLRARVKVNIPTYIGGAPGDLIEIRLKLALRVLYNAAGNHAAADDALDAWLDDEKSVRALAEGTRLALVSLERIDRAPAASTAQPATSK